MLSIYYGRESCDKENFIYEKIKEDGYDLNHRVIVIVPDQYSIEAERQAFHFLEKDCLIGLDIFSMSRLGHKLTESSGDAKKTFIDKYGRHMLLTMILKRHQSELKVFTEGTSAGSFINKVNDLISDFKQYSVTSEQLRLISTNENLDVVLRGKLSDLALIYEEYEKRIAGKYTDSEDKTDMYIGAVSESDLIRNSKVWIYGFDSFAPKSIEFITAIMKQAEEVNIVLTLDDTGEEVFELSRNIKNMFISLADENGVVFKEVRKIRGFEYKASPSCKFIENELYAEPPGKFEGNPADLKILRASNVYSEAESCAAEVLRLLRDKNYRKRDIAIICNSSSRAEILRRVFEEYGIELFMDAKRSILTENLSVYVLSLLSVVAKNYRQNDIFCALKTDLSGISASDVEKLESYAIKYRIKGGMWKKPFTKGSSEREYGEEGLAEINEIREKVVGIFDSLSSIVKSSKSYGEFVAAFENYLIDDLGIIDKLNEEIDRQESYGMADAAQETLQVFGLLQGVLEQLKEILDEEPFSIKEFVELLSSGLEGVELGVVPSSIDDIILGTMQRSRIGDVKALFVVAANEGIIPQQPAEDGILGAEEIEEIAIGGSQIARLDSVRVREEKLAIYRNLSTPKEKLWISYAEAGEDGKSSRKSSLVEDIQALFPEAGLFDDILDDEDKSLLLGGKLSSKRHLIEALGSAVRKDEALDPMWKSLHSWLKSDDPEFVKKMDSFVAFENVEANLSPEQSELLFRNFDGRRVLSPSALENFTRCSFAYFVNRVLKPEERRVYEAASREIGDVYHHCIMNVTSELNAKNLWDSVSDEDCLNLVRQNINIERENYNEGLFKYGNREEYRLERMEKACFEAVKALVAHMRAGKTKEGFCEIKFGKGQKISPIEIDTPEGKVYIEGQIDRVDILENGRIKIIDYKSSPHELKYDEVTNGYNLQLMLYMKAAEQDLGIEKPGGVFYFQIKEPRIKADGSLDEEALQKKIKDELKLKGWLIDDPDNVNQIAGEIEPKADSEVVASVRRNSDGELRRSGTTTLISEEEFTALQEELDVNLEGYVTNMLEGDIAIEPMKSGSNTPCSYCDFKTICNFNLAFDGCKYHVIR